MVQHSSDEVPASSRGMGLSMAAACPPAPGEKVLVSSSDRKWVALQVRPRYEKAAARALHNKGYEEFLPLYKCPRRWTDRLKQIELPLFPGYVFCRFDLQVVPRIVPTVGVIRIVGMGKTPAFVDESEIAAIQAIVQSGVRSQPWPYLRARDLVRLEDGPLCGLEGILLSSKNDRRLVVSVSLLQRSVAVEIDRQWVTLIKPARGGAASDPNLSVVA